MRKIIKYSLKIAIWSSFPIIRICLSFVIEIGEGKGNKNNRLAKRIALWPSFDVFSIVANLPSAVNISMQQWKVVPKILKRSTVTLTN